MHDAELIFVWSRMRVVDAEDYSSKTSGRHQLQNLDWYEFLEAIVRVAGQKALPTDEEVAAADCEDGGHMLTTLRSNRPDEYRDFVAAHRREWHEGCRQPIARAVHHLLALVVRTIHFVVAKAPARGAAARVMAEPLTCAAVERFLLVADELSVDELRTTVHRQASIGLAAALEEHGATLDRASRTIAKGMQGAKREPSVSRAAPDSPSPLRERGTR